MPNRYSSIDLCILRGQLEIPRQFRWTRLYFSGENLKILEFWFQFQPIFAEENFQFIYRFFKNYSESTVGFTAFANSISKIKKLFRCAEILTANFNLELIQELKGGRMPVRKINQILGKK